MRKGEGRKGGVKDEVEKEENEEKGKKGNISSSCF